MGSVLGRALIWRMACLLGTGWPPRAWLFPCYHHEHGNYNEHRTNAAVSHHSCAMRPTPCTLISICPCKSNGLDLPHRGFLSLFVQFSVLRYESVIHEFDPYFNYRSTIMLVKVSACACMDVCYGTWPGARHACSAPPAPRAGRSCVHACRSADTRQEWQHHLNESQVIWPFLHRVWVLTSPCQQQTASQACMRACRFPPWPTTPLLPTAPPRRRASTSSGTGLTGSRGTRWAAWWVVPCTPASCSPPPRCTRCAATPRHAGKGRGHVPLHACAVHYLGLSCCFLAPP